MIEFTVGVPGSGKSYRAVYALYANFGLDEKIKDSKFIHNDVNIAYTNINELNLDSFKSGSVKNLDLDIFLDSLTILHGFYKAKYTDTQLIQEAKKLDLFECLIIIDECHNLLDIQNKILVWWLSYHRHLHHQVYLITQNLGLVNAKYKTFSEFFYIAKASSLKLFKNKMIYNEFTSSRLSQVSKTGTIKIPFVQTVYDSYHSGANQQSQNVIKKFLLIAAFLFVFLIIMILGLQAYMKKDIVEAPINKIIDTKINYPLVNDNPRIIEDKLIIDKVEELKLFKFICSGVMCSYNFTDKQSIKIPSNILKSYLLDIEIDKKYIDLKNNFLSIYVLVPKNTFNFLDNTIQGSNNEENGVKNSFSDTIGFK